jgi:hypothetical protein
MNVPSIGFLDYLVAILEISNEAGQSAGGRFDEGSTLIY